MKTRTFLVLLCLTLGCAGSDAAPLGSAIPYQGRLTDNNAGATGSFDMRWALFDGLTGGTQRSPRLTSLAVPVANGLFNVALPFGDTVFDGTALFLEIEVRPIGSAGGFVPLAPRQAILPTAYALTAFRANSVPSGSIGTAQLANGSVTPAKLAGVSLALDHLSAPDGSPTNAVQVDNNGNVRLGSAMNIGRSGSHYDELGYNVAFSEVNDTYTYIGHDYASSIRLGFSGSSGGGMEFRTAPYSGARGAPLTLTTRMVLTEAGKLGIGTTAPLAGLHVEGGGLIHRSGAGVALYLQSSARQLRLQSEYSGGHAYMEYYADGELGAMSAWVGYGSDGQTDFTVLNGKGDIRLVPKAGGAVRLPVLTITGGSDLSERFDVAAPGGALEPGMVVCIDPANPGKLVRSTRALDRTVAGIISGAGGVRTGMLMGQEGSVADGKYPVALTGRVYVHADASATPIQPGDLLTTSDTPGHCQVVTDHAQASGAIIGKAMSGLAAGKGLVLVLVSLQ